MSEEISPELKGMLQRARLKPSDLGVSHDMRNPHDSPRVDCVNPYCMFCEGGIEVCVECGGAESTLTTHCPLEQISYETGQRITAMKLDYRDDKWVEL